MRDPIDEPFIKFMEENLLTTPEEKDPTKPLIVDTDDMVHPNPAFSQQAAFQRQMEEHQKNLGTSFVLFFSPFCNVHQLPGYRGEEARANIKLALEERLMVTLEEVLRDHEGWEKVRPRLFNRLEVAICPTAQSGFNNGEVYLWMRGIPFTEDFTVKVLLSLKKKIEEYPIEISWGDQKYTVLFYGWGFRYI